MREVDNSPALRNTEDTDERNQKPEDIFSCISKEIFAAPPSGNQKTKTASESPVEKNPQKKELPPLPYADASMYPPFVDDRGLPKTSKDRKEEDAASPTNGKSRSRALTEIPSIKELFKSLNLTGTKDLSNEPLPYADASMYPPSKQVTRNSDELPSSEKPKSSDDSLLDLLKLLNIKPEGKDEWTVTDKVEPGKKLEDATIEKYASDIATILVRNTDFAYGPKKERMQKMFEEAGLAGKESFEKLVAAINKKLEPSGMKLDGKIGQWTSESTEIHHPMPKDRNLDIYYYPQKITTKKDGISMDLSLKSKGGQEEDRMSLSKDIRTRVKSEIHAPIRIANPREYKWDDIRELLKKE